MFHIEEGLYGSYTRYTTERQDIMWAIMASVGDYAGDLDLDAYADVLYRYDTETGRYYEVACEDIDTGAIEACVLVPHAQYKLRDRSTNEEMIVSRYTPTGPIERFFFRVALKEPPFANHLAHKVKNALRSGHLPDLGLVMVELVPIPSPESGV